VADQNSVQEGIEAEIILEDWIFKFFYILIEICFNILPTVDGGVLLDFVHDLDDNIQRFCYGVCVEAYFELSIVILFGVFKNAVEYLGHHAADDAKCNIKIVLVSEQSEDYLLEADVFIAIEVLGVMICDEGSIHFANFQLKGIFYEGSPNEIVVLSFEAFEVASDLMDGVVFVEFPILDVVADGAAGSGFDLEDEGVAVLVDVATIDL
jgi:hypothetical protein